MFKSKIGFIFAPDFALLFEAEKAWLFQESENSHWAPIAEDQLLGLYFQPYVPKIKKKITKVP